METQIVQVESNSQNKITNSGETPNNNEPLRIERDFVEHHLQLYFDYQRLVDENRKQHALESSKLNHSKDPQKTETTNDNNTTSKSSSNNQDTSKKPSVITPISDSNNRSIEYPQDLKTDEGTPASQQTPSILSQFLSHTVTLEPPNLEFFSFYFKLLETEALLHKSEMRTQSLMDLWGIFFELLLPICRDYGMKVVLMRKINGLIFNSTFIKGYCSDRMWILRCLEFLKKNAANSEAYNVHVELLTLIQILALFHITQYELRTLLQVIQSDWAAPYWSLFVVLLQKMALPREHPDVFFAFSGRESGLMLPFYKWPYNGYTLVCWIRIESFSEPPLIYAHNSNITSINSLAYIMSLPTFEAPNSDSYSESTTRSNHVKYRPRLFRYGIDDRYLMASFLGDEDGVEEGIEAYFIDNRLALSSRGNNKPDVKTFNFPFESKKWYFLVISHEHRVIRKSHVRLSINGDQHIEEINMAYPKVTQQLSSCHIGNTGYVTYNQNHRAQPLIAQFGTIILLDSFIYQSDVNKVYELGPNLSAKFNGDSEIVSGQRGTMFMLDRKVMGKILFSYSPQASVGMLCMDTATGEARNHATKMEGVRVWATQSINEAVQPIGGVKSILTLFTLLDTNMKSKILHQDPAPLFSLLLTMAQHNPPMFEEDLGKCSGFQILGYLLEKIPQQWFTADTIFKLEQLVVFIHNTYGVHGMLFDDIIRNILMNFRLWIYTSGSVQLRVMQVIANMVSKAPGFFRNHVGIETFVDILDFFYWIVPSSRGRLYIQKSCISRRCMIGEIMQIRLALVRIASLLVQGYPNSLRAEEAHRVITYLRDYKDSEEQTADVLKYFARALNTYFEKFGIKPSSQSLVLISSLDTGQPQTNGGATSASSDSPSHSAMVEALHWYIMQWESHPIRPTPGLARLISIPIALAYNRPNIPKKWLKLLISLDDHQNSGAPIQWKLSAMENAKRMRLRLKRDYYCRDYTGCAKPMNADIPDTVPVEAPSPPTEAEPAAVNSTSEVPESAPVTNLTTSTEKSEAKPAPPAEQPKVKSPEPAPKEVTQDNNAPGTPKEEQVMVDDEEFVMVDKSDHTPGGVNASSLILSANEVPKQSYSLCDGIYLCMVTNDPKDIFKEGFLIKRGRFTKNWHTRLFTLSNSKLDYKWEGRVHGSILLKDSYVQKSEEKFPHVFCFEIVTSRKVYYLAADTRFEMEDWIRAITNAIPNANASNNNIIMTINPVASMSSDPPIPKDKDLKDIALMDVETNQNAKEKRIDTLEEVTLSLLPASELLYKCSCELILPMDRIEGTFEVTSGYLYFHASKAITKQSFINNTTLKKKDWSWPVSRLREIYRRNYLLRNSAIEIFLEDRRSILINFPVEETGRALLKILSLRAANLINCASISPDKIIMKSKLTKKWVEREITNFDYLMALNTLSGRTFNDLNTYPVFPWVLQDYSSETLDLENPQTFRDLSKPIGALNEERLQQYIERYNSFDDPVIPKFHYGTHYSNVGNVLYYLMRIEPATQYFAQLGGGKFDRPERMFLSVEGAWQGVLTNNNNVKELIPEFFYLPDFLKNTNRVDFGSTLKEGKIEDVILPKWANSPEDFINKHREALESEHVSAHLHEWIDLIFGYKQRGEEAEKAYNTFFWLTYPGMVDLDAIQDPVEKKSMEAQILNFGVCPTVLFTKPHPKRMSIDSLKNRGNFLVNTLNSALSVVSAALSKENVMAELTASTTNLTAMPTQVVSSPGVAHKEKEVDKEADYTVGSLDSNTNEVSEISNRDMYSPQLNRRPSLATVEPLTPQPSTSSPDLSRSDNDNGPSYCQDVPKDPSIDSETVEDKEESERVSTTVTDATRFRILKESKMMPLIAIECCSDTLLLIFRDGAIAVNSFQATSPRAFTCVFDKTVDTEKPKKLDSLISSDQVRTLSNCFCLSADGKVLISSGSFDNSFRFFSIPNINRLTLWKSFIHEHTSTVSAIALQGTILVTCSSDGQVKVWTINLNSQATSRPIKLRHRLLGHLDRVNCVDLNVDEDLIVTGAMDGTLRLYGILKGKFLRAIQFSPYQPQQSVMALQTSNTFGLVPTLVKITSQALIVTFCGSQQGINTSYTLSVHTITGRLLARVECKQKIHDMKIFKNGKFVVTGDSGGQVTVRSLPSLRVFRNFDLTTIIRSVALSNEERFLFAGLENGELFIIPLES